MARIAPQYDAPSATLIAVAHSARLAGFLPAATGKNIHDSARAVRLALEAGEPAMAMEILHSITSTCAELKGSLPERITHRARAIERSIDFTLARQK